MRDSFLYVNEKGDKIEFSMKSGFVPAHITGVSENTVTIATAKGTGQVGETFQGVSVNTRPISFEGILLGESTIKKEKLLSVVLPGVSAKLYHNNEFFLEVTPQQTPYITADDYFAKFQFSLLAAYPYWRKDAKSQTSLTGVKKRFKFPWNISQPYRFGEEIITTYINIRNEGQIDVPFTAEFWALSEIVNPTITNIITGEMMMLNYTMSPNERVTVEITHDLTYVTSSIQGDIRGVLDLDSNLFRLASGDNLLKPDAEGGAIGLQVSIIMSEEKVGVAIC